MSVLESTALTVSSRNDRAKKESGDFERILEGMNLYRLLLVPLLGASLLRAETPRFKVATYNVENYLVERSGTRAPKPEAARRKVTETLASLRPDVVALQEIGPTNALIELQSRLRQAGLDLPHWEHVSG
jgi:hypothetical protein